MDFDSLMVSASSRVNDGHAIRKRGYSSDLPPPKKQKKEVKNGPRSAAIQAFLDKKKAEEKRKEDEEKRERQRIMAQQQQQKQERKFKIPKSSTNDSAAKAGNDTTKSDKEVRPTEKPSPAPNEDTNAKKYVSEEAKQKHKEFLKRVEGSKQRSEENESPSPVPPRKPIEVQKKKGPPPPSGPMDFASLMKIANKKSKDPALLKKEEEEEERKRLAAESVGKKKTPLSGRELLEKEMNSSASSSSSFPKSTKPGPKSFKEKQLSQLATSNSDRSQASSSSSTSKGDKTKSSGGVKWPADAPRHIPSSSTPKDKANQGCDITKKSSSAPTSRTSTPVGGGSGGSGNGGSQSKSNLSSAKCTSGSSSASSSKSSTPTKSVPSSGSKSASSTPSKPSCISNVKGKQSAPPRANDAPPFRRNVEDGAARWDSLMQKSKASANKKSSKKRVIDSDSEYDSEMDDFIDDGDAGVDVSSMIKDIFGYDKNKYKYQNEESDDDMETNFASIQKEEKMSAKLGLKEDLEDMRKEAEEEKRKAAKKKAAAKAKKR